MSLFPDPAGAPAPSAVDVPRPDPPRGRAAPVGADLLAWNQALNRTHAMAALRERGGLVVRAIEERRRALVAARVLSGAHGVVVDAGCEDGWMSEAWADRTRRLVLLDLDPEVLASSALAGRPGVRTAVADLADRSAVARALPGVRADVVVLSAVLEHLPDPSAALEALAPVVRPGGRIVLYVPADGPILLAKAVLRASGLGRLVRGLPLGPAPGHLHRFDRRGLVDLLAGHGRVLEVSFDPAALGYVGVLDPHRRACRRPGAGPHGGPRGGRRGSRLGGRPPRGGGGPRCAGS